LRADDPDVGDRVGVEALCKQARVTLAGPWHATRDHSLDVGVTQTRAPDRLGQDPSHLLLRERRPEAQPFATREQPVEVILETEETAPPPPDHAAGQG